MVILKDKDNSSSPENEGLDISCTHSEDDETEQTELHPNNVDLKSNTEDNGDVMLKLSVNACKELGQRIKRIFYFILNDMEGSRIIDRFAQWCIHHPHMSICLLSAGLVISLPILLFIAFALSSIVMTLTGFLVLEGTLLTIITMIMLGLLAALGMMLLFFSLIGFATYFGVSHVYEVYSSAEAERTNLNSKKT